MIRWLMTAFVIAGGSLVDGSGRSPTPRDLEIEDGRISAITEWSDDHGRQRVLDATGLTVAPGFIDVHSHADNAPFLPDDDLTKLLQGVTTEVVGNCGMTLAPRSARNGWSPPLFPPVSWEGESFAEYLSEADQRGYVTNYAPLIGHGTVRASVVGLEGRAATASELAEMRAVVLAAIEAGAFGLSTGLIYPPGSHADAAELVMLCEGLPQHAVYATHLRNESNRLVESVAEAIGIAEAAGVRLQLSHHKSMGESNWGRTAVTLELIDAARQRGIVAHQDVYPYTASSTTMTALLPPQFHEGGPNAIMGRLRDEEQIARLRDLLASEDGWDNKVAASGWHAIRVASTRSHAYEGRYMLDVAAELDTDPVRAMVELLLAEELAVTMTVDAMSEADVERVLRDGHTMIGSDGLPPGLGGKPHPRICGTFPRILQHYVRESGLLPLEEAVRRMTSLPARAFGIAGRGLLETGAVADLVVFDALGVEDRATYRDPLLPPLGIKWVLLAGKVAVEDGRYLGVRRGRRLRPLVQ